MQMLSGLFPINTNSLISSTSSIVYYLHQGTTFKELLSLVFYRKRAHLHKVTLTFTFMHQVSLTFEDADIHSAQLHNAIEKAADMRHDLFNIEEFMYIMCFVLVFVVVTIECCCSCC